MKVNVVVYLASPTDGGPPKLSISSSSLSAGGGMSCGVGSGILASTGGTSPIGASSNRPPSKRPPAGNIIFIYHFIFPILYINLKTYTIIKMRMHSE